MTAQDSSFIEAANMLDNALSWRLRQPGATVQTAVADLVRNLHNYAPPDVSNLLAYLPAIASGEADSRIRRNQDSPQPLAVYATEMLATLKDTDATEFVENAALSRQSEDEYYRFAYERATVQKLYDAGKNLDGTELAAWLESAKDQAIEALRASGETAYFWIFNSLCQVEANPDYPWNLDKLDTKSLEIVSFVERCMRLVRRNVIAVGENSLKDEPGLRPLLFPLVYARRSPEQAASLTADEQIVSRELSTLSQDAFAELVEALHYVKTHPELDTANLPPYWTELNDREIRSYLEWFSEKLPKLRSEPKDTGA